MLIPTMAVTHLVFAVLLTAYIFIAIWFEERNLIDHFGDHYRNYRRRVGALLPRMRMPETESARVPDRYGSEPGSAT
jgi:protein-S-isoprenylcysteine O-methyltransferase Ste14